MSTHYDFARSTKQVHMGSRDLPILHMASKTAAYRPSQPNQSSSRLVPGESTSLPQTSWLSDVASEFTPSPLSQSYLGVGLSAPGPDSLLSSSRSLCDSGQPSHPIHRERSRDYQLSTSPTHPSGSSSRSRHTPSPRPSPSHTLHTSRSFTASSSHKTSGMSSDRDASGHLDLKRLMSKPARQTLNNSVTLLPDSDRSGGDASSSRAAPSRRPSESAVPHLPLSLGAHASREKLSLHVNTSGLRSSSAPHYGHTPSPERRQPAIEEQTSRAARNVLHRRPSARSSPGTPTIAHFRAATDDQLPPARTASVKRSQPQLRDDTPFAAYARRPKTSPSTLAPRPNTSPRTQSASSKSPQIPIGLTPAGAVALAYKQQEQRREELAETASFNDAYRPSSAVPPSPLARKLTNTEEEEGGGPYYTIFGSSSGRLVAVGSPDDDDWQYSGFDTRTTVTISGKPAASGSRSLSRKVSGSFKRVTGSIKRDKEREPRPPLRDQWKPYDGSHLGHGRGSPSQSLSKSARRPITLDTALEGKTSPRESPTVKLSPATKSSPSPKEDGRLASRASKLKGKEREEAAVAAAELSPGGRWWKLMKRISTGGLRDKYQHQDEPPPVPALPQNLTHMAPSRTTMDISSRDLHGEEVSENGVLLRRFMQSRTSLSGVRPTLTPRPKTPSTESSRPNTGTAGPPSSGNTTKSRASISGHRPSTATRSSSPDSSGVASASFFNHNRTPSTRSSFSSYGEEIPPVPKNLGQYILSPRELSRIAKSPDLVPSSRSKPTRMTGRSHTAPATDISSKGISLPPDDENVISLPLPPRRATTGTATSPLAPSFNVEDTINTFMPPQHSAPLLLGEFGMKEPPPRPKRSVRRAPPPNVDVLDVSLRSQSLSATTPRSPQTPRQPPPVRVDVDLVRRPSTGALSYASTARQQSAGSSNPAASAVTSPSSAVSQKRSPLTFRELEGPRQRLTEKEKADKWEDLLERSARAGGTLHIGESRLPSEDPDIDADDSFLDGSDSDV